VTRILVTGASGFLGRNLVEAIIQSGHEPVAWVHREASANDLRELGLEVHVGDLSATDAFRKPWLGVSTVVHLAGVVAPYSRTSTFRVNVDTTRRLAEDLGGWNSPPRFLYVSSLAAVGPSPTDSGVREQHQCIPTSIYGQSKLAAEAALKMLADRLPVSVIRPPGVIGNWDRNLLEVYRLVRWGWNVVGISKEFRYSFIHAEDLCRGILSIAQHGESLRGGEDPEVAGIYHVADPDPITMVQLADMVAASLGPARVRHLRLPRPVCWGLAGISDAFGRFLGVRTFLNLDKMREAAAGSWVCDTTRVQQQLDFRVGATLAQRIREVTHWYQGQGWLPNVRENAT